MGIIDFIRQLSSSNSVKLEDFAADDVLSLAEENLTKAELAEAEELSNSIISGGRRKKHAVSLLQQRVGHRPKRPIYYVTEQYLPRLPHHTREVMRYLGDYIDQLVKCIAKENHQGSIFFPKSLGSNLKPLSKVIPEELIDQLAKYNRYLYVPAKHDFDVKGRPHRFSNKEVIIALYITLKIAQQLKSISPMAKLYSEDKLPQSV